MRLNATVINVDLFQKLVLAVEKINKECVFFLTPKKIQLILTNDVTDGVQVWSGVNVHLLFDAFIIESLNNGEIAFKINCNDLNRALKSALDATKVVMKLTKKGNDPFLNFHIQKMSRHNTLKLQQDIPVEILTASQIASYVEPNLPDPDACLHLFATPEIYEERNREHENEYVTITANMNGELSLTAEASLVSVSTLYNNLDHPHRVNIPSMDTKQQASVKVDIKKISRFLYSHVVSPSEAICLFVKERVLVLLVTCKDELHITYYIPVILTDTH